ncbi:MAG: right-handed parallel beta-helix repeat-containing protein [Clostridia bacterium]|nr:right-handed parallel beta-helix repeat-containing protein [Clostridia bacterium]
MKIKKKISALLTVIVTIGSITAFAAPADLGDTEYYNPVQALVDFQDKTPMVLPTEPSGQNFIQNYYLEEANGNRYYYAGRYADIASGWNAFAYKPASHTFDASGEYSMQSKIKLTQQSGSQIHLIFQATPGDKQYFTFEINGINSLDDVPEKSNFKIEWSGGSKTIPTSFSYPLKAETWYTFRNTYNLDDRSVKLEMYDAAGTELLATTGEIELPETVTLGTSEYTVPNPTSFRIIRGDFNQKTGGVGIDDFIISKAAAAAVTLQINGGGTVKYGEKTIASGQMVAVPFGSVLQKTFTFTPEAGESLRNVFFNNAEISLADDYQINKSGILTVVFKKDAPGASELYVAENGSDATGDGSKDKPFASIEGARNAIRNYGKLPTGGVTVWIRGGDYSVSDPIEFTALDSGSAECPITYQAYNGEKVKFVGSEKIDASGIEKVTDEALLNRLTEKYAADHLYQINLKEQGIALPVLKGNAESVQERIYINNTALINARWPNDDKTGEQYYVRGEPAVLSAEQQGKYNGNGQPVIMKYTDKNSRTANWQFKQNDSYLSGAIAYLWFPESLLIGSLNPELKQVTTSGTSGYGQNTYTAKNERYLFFENIFEEIDQPGESYLDRETGILYFYPIGSVEKATLSVARQKTYLIEIRDASHITIKGIEFAETCGNAMGITGNNITVDGVKIHGVGRSGIVLSGENIAVKNCHIYDFAEHGIDVSGGNRETLQPAQNLITENMIHSGYGRLVRGIHLRGVGHTVSHNTIYDIPQEAIRYNDLNNAVIEYNHIYDVQLLNADGGAIYAGRNCTDLGNIIRYNYFNDIGGHLGQHGQQAIFMDDGEIGPAVYGNVFLQSRVAGLSI